MLQTWIISNRTAFDDAKILKHRVNAVAPGLIYSSTAAANYKDTGTRSSFEAFEPSVCDLATFMCTFLIRT